jgi:hypothetical protein
VEAWAGSLIAPALASMVRHIRGRRRSDARGFVVGENRRGSRGLRMARLVVIPGE